MNTQNTCVVRRLQLGEEQLYRAVRLEALRESPNAFSSSFADALCRKMESWKKQADEASEGDERAIFVAFEERPVGLAAIYRDERHPSEGELMQMWIAPSHRGSGAAENLLSHLCEWAAARSIELINAEVMKTNQRALRFYERCGFRELASTAEGVSLVKAIKGPQVGLRPAAIEDLEWLDPFYESVMRPIVELTHSWDESKFREAFGNGKGMVITSGERNIGFYKVEDRSDCIYLGDIQIHPAFQNQGVGTRLIEELLSRATCERRSIRLRVLKGNRARLIYERLGFKEAAELDNCHEMEWQPNPISDA